MTFPSFQTFVDGLTAHLGWGTVITTVLSAIGTLLWKLYGVAVTGVTNHAEHIEASTARIEQKTDTLITLANTQNVLIAGMVTGSKDISVAVAKIETIESLLRERKNAADVK